MAVRVLFVSCRSDDAASLGRMLDGVVELDHVGTLAQARKLLAEETYRAVLTEAVLPDGTWTDMLRLVRRLAPQAEVIVTDPLADADLWTEALEKGCYDLIARPFYPAEVQRIVSTAACRRTLAA